MISEKIFSSPAPLVVGLGEVLWDVFPEGKKLGGAPANFAYHAAAQGCNACVVSAVGDDELGREIESALAEKNLAASLPRVARPTGTVRIALDSAGVATYVFAENCAWDNLPFTAEFEAVARRTAAVCFGSLAQRSPRSRETISRFLDCVPADAIRVFDANLRQNFYADEILRESLRRCTILKINEDEAPIIAAAIGGNARADDSIFPEIFRFSPMTKIVVLTLGNAGSLVASRNGERSFCPADSSIAVADTVGAGDSFTASFVSALLLGKPLSEAHRHAADVANFVCSRHGAMPEIPPALRVKQNSRTERSRELEKY